MTLNNASAAWDTLDAELARWLRMRTSMRTARDRDASPLDGVAIALRQVRGTLAFVASNVHEDDAALEALVSRCYRWTIRIARELETIEHMTLDELGEWSRFEAFAPFALAFFDSVLGAPFATVKKTAEVARLRREIDAVLAPISSAMASSAMAA